MVWTPMNKRELQKEVDAFPFGEHSDTIDSWDISNISDLSHLFKNNKKFCYDTTLDECNTNQIIKCNTTRPCRRPNLHMNISNWNVGHVTNMSGMFFNCNINQPLHWDVSHVTNMSQMFCKATLFDQPLQWDVSHVTDMSEMFSKALSFNQPLDWDVRHVTNMSEMFYNAVSFHQSLKSWNVDNLMFFGCQFSKITELFRLPSTLSILHIQNCNIKSIDIPTQTLPELYDINCINNPFNLKTIEGLIKILSNSDLDDGYQLDYLLQRKQELMHGLIVPTHKISRVDPINVFKYLGGKTKRKRRKYKKTYRK
jgi:surface protein